MSGSLILIGGGVRSGKSRFALQRARAIGERRAFVATALAFDEEMRARIGAHVRERGADFTTVEEPRELARVLRELATKSPAFDVVVVDCLTLWLSNLLLESEEQESCASDTVIAEAINLLRETLLGLPFDLILVTNEVGLGVVPEHALARRFRDHAGRLHQALAEIADEVFFAAMGLMLRLVPAPIEAVAQDFAALPSHSSAGRQG